MFKNEGGLKIKLIDFSLTKKFDPEQETKISFGTAEYVGNFTSVDEQSHLSVFLSDVFFV